MSYDEHLISMAGGDGETLDAIQRRIPKIPESEMSNTEKDRAYLLALVREQRTRIDAVGKILDEKYKLWAAICGNTCSKDIVGVDHDAIADEVVGAIRAALQPTK